MDKISLAGTIGTWVAVFLAILALIGVVGPVLVWRASRTERQVALKTVDSGLAENGGFMTNGVQLWPGIRLFRRIRAPILTADPTLGLTPINWNSDMRQVSKSSTSWVKFGLLIQSYRIPHETGDPLVIKNSHALLPVNKVWLLVVGLLGRFGERKDMGKVSRKRIKGVISAQAVPGWGMPSPESLFRDDSMHRWMAYERPRARDVYERATTIAGVEYSELHGLTGTLLIPRYHDFELPEALRFAFHGPEEIGNLGNEVLSIDVLFWLAVGCIPSVDGRVFSLENAHLLDFDDDDDDDDDSGQEGNAPHRYDRNEIYEARYESDEESEEIIYVAERRHNPRKISQNTYIQNQRAPRSTRHISGARAFRFSPTDERSEAFSGIARVLQVERTNSVVMSLEEMPVWNDERADLERLADVTYLPSDSTWVRLPRRDKRPGKRRSRRRRDQRDDGTQENGSIWYLQRKDAQVLAQSLLRLPICQMGYLFSANQSSLCYQFLSSAAPNAPRLLFYMINNFAVLRIPEASRKNLLAAMNEMFRLTHEFQYTRAFMDTIYELDTLLQHALPLDEKILDAIGVLTISSEEFRDLINMSIRRIPQSIDQTVQLDLDHPALIMRTVLGAEQRFPVDLSALCPNHVASQSALDISFSNLILIVLKASLRSAFLKTSLDSLPLFEQVMKMEDVVYIG